jgi:uncharacterized damage-inducible protein DinB
MMQYGDLFEYNAWANAAVLAAMDQMNDEQLRTEMPELGGSALGLLEHTAQVEAAFLWLLTGEARPERRAGMAYSDVRALLTATDAAFQAALPALERRLADPVEVPWFRRSFEIGQALLQVPTHSVQHRAGVCAGIGRAGLQAPGLDYIMWLNAHR